MRLIATLLMFAALVFTTARAAEPGAYASPTAAVADDCIKLCQDDTLCVGWTYTSGACGLWASVPKQTPSAFTLSSRASNFAQPVPVVSTAAAPTPPSPPQPRHEQASIALLGGNDRAESLRPRFGDGH